MTYRKQYLYSKFSNINKDLENRKSNKKQPDLFLNKDFFDHLMVQNSYYGIQDTETY